MERTRQTHFDVEEWGIRPPVPGDLLQVGDPADPDSFAIVLLEREIFHVGELTIPSEYIVLWKWNENSPGPRARVAVHMKTAPNGIGECERVTVSRAPGGPPVTTSTLRIPLDRLITTSARRASFAIGEDGYLELSILRPDEGEALWEGIRPGPGRGRKLPDEVVRQVADIYREAAAKGDNPTAAVAARMNYSRSYAGKLVMEARKRGMLGPAPRPGQKGEASTPKRNRKRKEKK